MIKQIFRIPPISGILGFLGILGILYDPFFCVFFGFFGFFFWGLLGKEKSDERLQENIANTVNIAGRSAVVLCFFLLFALEKHISGDVVLLGGSLAYAALFVLTPALAYFFDKRG